MKATRRRIPLTCACTATVCSGSTCPLAASSKGTDRRSAVATVTGTGGGGGGSLFEQAASRARPRSDQRDRGANAITIIFSVSWSVSNPVPLALLRDSNLVPARFPARLPLRQGFLNDVRHIRVGLLEFGQTVQHLPAPDRHAGPGVSNGILKPLPAGQPLGHGLADQIPGNPIVILAVGWAADLLEHSPVFQEPGVGADTGLAY